MTAIDFDLMPAEINTTKIHRIKEKLSLPFAANLNFEKFKRASFSGKMSSDSLRNSFPLSTFKLQEKCSNTKAHSCSNLKGKYLFVQKKYTLNCSDSNHGQFSYFSVVNFGYYEFLQINQIFIFLHYKKCKFNLASKT